MCSIDMSVFLLDPLFPLLAGSSCICRIFLLVTMELLVLLPWSLLYWCKYIWTYCGVWLQIISSFVLKTIRKSKIGNVYTIVVHTFSKCVVSCFTYFIGFDVHLLQVKLHFLKLTARNICCTARNYFSLNLVNGQSIKVHLMSKLYFMSCMSLCVMYIFNPLEYTAVCETAVPLS
jgi:hypothetical protein